MLHHIAPRCFDRAFCQRQPGPHDLLLVFRGDQVLLSTAGEEVRLPAASLLRQPEQSGEYLFAIDDSGFFLAPPEAVNITPELAWQSVGRFRELYPEWLAFAGITGYHLWQWLVTHAYCGQCGGRMEKSLIERALVCPACGLVEYPSISPAVIVGVRDGERLLLTRYAGRSYRRYALIAGFVEIGEAVEDTVRREVLEETGLQVGELHYFASQPWAFSQSLLLGFFADLAGPDQVSLNDGELAEAVWFERQQVPESANTLSLTATMMEAFRNGQDKKYGNS